MRRDATLLRHEDAGHDIFRAQAQETETAMADFFRRVLDP